jgi:polyribonucleotide nucleotidyltransferase
MVPNGLVSMIIGTKGRQISNLIRETQANIVVNQPIYKMHHRTVSISGKPGQVANAITRIQEIMEERYYEVSKVEMECKPLNVNTTRTHVNLCFLF